MTASQILPHEAGPAATSSHFQQLPFSSTSGVSPLPLPAPAGGSSACTIDTISQSQWQRQECPASGSLATPATSAAASTFATPCRTSSQPPLLPYSSAPARPRPAEPSGPARLSPRYYCSPSARPSTATLTRASGQHPLSMVSPPRSDRARLLDMEVDKASWEAEKAGYLRHIQVLEEKLKDAISEKEGLQSRLDATLFRREFQADQEQEGACRVCQQQDGDKFFHEHSSHALSQSSNRGRVHPPSTFVPHDNIPGAAAATTTATFDEMVVVTQAQVNSTTNSDGTAMPEATVSATVYHSSEQHTHSTMAPWSPPAPEPIETLDVSTIDPELEGIRLKAAAVQRPTFSLSLVSPPLSAASSDTAAPRSKDSESVDPKLPPRLDSEFLVCDSAQTPTVHALAAAESGRRLMHAGYTPTHRVFHFPDTVTDEVAEAALGAAQDLVHEFANKEAAVGAGGEMLCEPIDDTPLRGHLMAQSDGTRDIFLDEFTKKLQAISTGARDGVPAVLKNSYDAATEAMEADIAGSEPGRNASEVDIVADLPDEIPLKFKPTTNFGLPWGQLSQSRRREEMHAAIQG